MNKLNFEIKEKYSLVTANEWNRLVSKTDELVDSENNKFTKVSLLTNDSGYITSSSIPTKVSQLTNDSGYITQHQDISGKANKSELSVVATTGSYTDLTNKPDLSALASIAQMQDGTDGITPTVTVTEINGGHNVAFYYGEDDERNVNFNVMDGTDGQDGADGQNGVNGTNGTNGSDGITPIVSVTEIANGHTITFNYGNDDLRNTSFNVLNGSAGQNGSNGTNGTNGQDGITPHIDSTTGNWFIGDTDTQVHAQGPAGQDAISQTLATVATTGNYSDLNGKPTIPDAQIQSDWNLTDSTAKDYIKNKPALSDRLYEDVYANGHEYVDLGLPSGTMWATKNLNANTPYKCGYHYRFAETESFGGSYVVVQGNTQNLRTISDPTYKNGIYEISLQSYDYSPYNSEELISTTLDKYEQSNVDGFFAEDDAARNQWGGLWHVPTRYECEELLRYCTLTAHIPSGSPDADYYTVTGPNGNSIIIPNSSYYDWRYDISGYGITLLTSSCHHDINLESSFLSTYGGKCFVMHEYGVDDMRGGTSAWPMFKLYAAPIRPVFSTKHKYWDYLESLSFLEEVDRINPVITAKLKTLWDNKASVWRGTLALYDALSPNYDSNTIYIIS